MIRVLRHGLLVLFVGVMVSGCATSQGSKLNELVKQSSDNEYTQALIDRLRNEGAEERHILEYFEIQQLKQTNQITDQEYQDRYQKLQVKIDANRIKREEKRRKKVAFAQAMQVFGNGLQQIGK